MEWTMGRRRARFLAGAFMASALSLASVASANAQGLPQRTTPQVALPTGLVELPDLVTEPGVPPIMGITLDQSRAAFNALATPNLAPSTTLSIKSVAGQAVAAQPISAVFISSAGVLSVMGTSANDVITVSRDAAGKLLVNGGAIPIQGGTSTVANTSLIQVFGQAGNDTIKLDEANGALPKALLFGGDGDDTIIGGSGADMLFGQAGNDTLLGKGGNDFLFGGDGNDTLTGGAGDDQVFGQAGNDRIIWNPGDGTDLDEGGDGIDTVEVNGGNGAEVFTATANGTRVRFDRISPAPFTLDIGTAENLTVNMNGGDDTFTGGNGLAPLINLTVDGGAGDDTITGGDGNDVLIGGDGNDTLIGGRGNDVVFGGAGDDVFIWNPGDGSDTLEGQSGTDTLQFNGANVSEKFDLSANGGRARLTRDVANIVMDMNDVEHVNLAERGGADTTSIHDLTGTHITNVRLDLSGTSGLPDGANDSVSVSGTSGADVIQVNGLFGLVTVDGLAAHVEIVAADSTDGLAVLGQDGDDVIDATALPAGAISLVEDGGNGDDVLIGGAGDDVLIGGAGDDVLLGGPGLDTLEGGTGNNILIQD